MEIHTLKGKEVLGNAQISKSIKLGAGDTSSAGISSSIPEEIEITSPEFPILPIEKESAETKGINEIKFRRNIPRIKIEIVFFILFA